MICYSKSTANHENTILVAVNLDAYNEQIGWTDLDLGRLAIPEQENFVVEDLLTGARYTWRDRRNYVALRPGVQPAHIFRIARQP
jgi:starch synthase (maltosyl-transferring)